MKINNPPKPPINSHIVVGMSGGVDSSVTALLLKEQGYRVTGMFMKNWEEDDDSEYCTARADLKDAQAICDRIGIPLKAVNFAAEYWDNVFETFLSELKAGRTPNPDILCNKEIKFKAFLEYAKHLGADYIATGHYARLHQADNHMELWQGTDSNKDQSYFLCALNQQQLNQTLFPLGDYNKTEIREIAHKHNFETARKKDSTGICFIGERKFNDFLERYLPRKKGDIVDISGNHMGTHNGLMYYTIGQRKGIGIGGHTDREEAPWYVAGKDIKHNQLVVCQGDNDALYRTKLQCTVPHWISPVTISDSLRCEAKIRYRQDHQSCTIQKNSDSSCYVQFDDRQRAVTPGQTIAFYQGQHCLGSATILEGDMRGNKLP